jgi:hypothetical protein
VALKVCEWIFLKREKKERKVLFPHSFNVVVGRIR